MVIFPFVGGAATPFVFTPVPLATGAAPRAVPLEGVALLATGPPLATVGTGAEALALLKLAAVGLLSRSITPEFDAAFLAGVGRDDCVLRALAREAAVGANSPEEGVFGRAAAVGVAVVCDGVFGRADGVFGLEGVLTGAGVVCDVRDDGRGRTGVGLGVAAFAGVDADVDGEGWYAVGGDLVNDRVGVRVEPPAVLGLPDLDGVVGGGVLMAPVLD